MRGDASSTHRRTTSLLSTMLIIVSLASPVRGQEVVDGPYILHERLGGPPLDAAARAGVAEAPSERAGPAQALPGRPPSLSLEQGAHEVVSGADGPVAEET